MTISSVARTVQAGANRRRNPFPGPVAYDASNRDEFFGRDDEIDELTSLVLSSSATLLYAPSGAGKSSLLQAGLAPVLNQDFGMRVLPIVHLGTGARVDAHADGPPGEGRDRFTRAVCQTILPADGTAPQPALGAALARLEPPSGERALLILDQFEEVFYEPGLSKERERFFKGLSEGLRQHRWLRCIIALRSDYLANLVPYERILPGRLAVRLQLSALTERQAATAIRDAFAGTGVRLSDDYLARLLDVLLEDPRGSPARASHVNNIQLQIVCRRLWDELSRAEHPEVAEATLPSERSVRASMQQFVDTAIGETVGGRRYSDEAAIRSWLAGRLITTTGRRAFVLLDDADSAGLPDRMIESLGAARLVQFEQRHGSRLVELTHDSMVEAVRASNEVWLRKANRRRMRRAAALLLLLALALALFPVLRVGDRGPLAQQDGYFTDAPGAIGFVAKGDASLIDVSLSGTGARADVSVLPDPQPAYAGAIGQQSVDSQKEAVFAVRTSPGAAYTVRLVPGGAVADAYYQVAVSDVPLDAEPDDRAWAVPADRVAVPVPRGSDDILSVRQGSLDDLAGVDLLASGDDWAVVRGGAQDGLAVLSLSGRVAGPDATKVTRQAVRGSPLPLGRNTPVKGGQFTFLTFATGDTDTALGAEVTCDDATRVYLLDTARATDADPDLAASALTSVLPLKLSAGQHTMLLAGYSDGSSVSCTLQVHSFAGAPVTEYGSQNLTLGTGGSAAAYALRLAGDAVVVGQPPSGLTVSLLCPGEPDQKYPDPSAAAPGRVLFYVPQATGCTLWLTTDPSAAAPGTAGAGGSLAAWIAPAGPAGTGS